MIGLRQVLVNDYFDVEDMVVLDTVRVHLPSPAHELQRVLDDDGDA
jgi:uncharacterized protein with HEPN domain